jgi:hypothetical protein
VTTRATLRADLRRDLRDEDPTAYVWSDTVLNRHLQHAIDLVQREAPRLASLLKVAPLYPQRIDLSGDVPASFLWVEAVEYPIDRYPQRWIPFREELGPRVYLQTPSLPPVGDQLRVWFAARYTVDDGAGDLPAQLEPIILAGALAFACEDQAVDTVPKLTPSGAAPAHYRAAAAAAHARFETHLATLRSSAAPLWRPTWSPT